MSELRQMAKSASGQSLESRAKSKTHPQLFQGGGRSTPEQARIAEFERLVRRLTMQLEIAKVSGLLNARKHKSGAPLDVPSPWV